MRTLPPRLNVYLLVAVVAACMWFASCVASRDYVDTRIQDLEKWTDARDIEYHEKERGAVLDIVSFVDPILPGITTAATQVYDGYKVSAPQPLPPREDPFPWLEVLGIVGAAFGVSVPAAVGATNHMRDKRRRNLNEATSMAEAAEMGYYDKPKEV